MEESKTQMRCCHSEKKNVYGVYLAQTQVRKEKKLAWRNKVLELIGNSARRIYIFLILFYNHDSYLGGTFVIRSAKNEIR